MTTMQRRKLIATILLIILSIFTVERLYNSRSEFQVTAMDGSYYGIVDAKLTTGEKVKDFEYLYGILETNYPFFKVNERLHGVDWLGNKKKYKRMIRNTKNDTEFFAAMNKILGDLNDGHTNILSGEEFKLTFKTYYDNLAEQDALDQLPIYISLTNPYVMFRYGFNGDMEGVEEYEEPNLTTKLLKEDELAYMKIKRMAKGDMLTKDYGEIKEFLKELEGYEKLIIDIRGNNGGSDDYWKKLVELLIDEPLESSYYAFFKDGHRFKQDPYRVDNATAITELDKEVLNQFPEEIRDDFNFYKTYDLKINPTDDSLEASEKINFSGKIYLLIDGNVFSSSEKFASFAKDTGFATLVGEATGGARVFEEVPIFSLPITKFAIKYSRELGMNADGSINMETKTIPHINVDATIHEDINKDECVQAVIRDAGN